MRTPGWFNEISPTLRLATPIMAGNVAQMLMGAVDTLMVGRLGVTPLAACAFANGIVAILLLAGLGMMQPISISGAHAVGGERKIVLSDILRAGLWIGALLGLIVGLVCSVFVDTLDLLGQEPEISQAAKPFFMIVGWSILPTMLTVGLKQFAETLNRPWIPMIIILAGVGLNALLNWVLIFGMGGIPAMGLTGAGWATLTARIATLVCLGLWVSSSHSFRGLLPTGWLKLPSLQRVKEMLHLGWPISAQLVMEVGAFALAAIFMGWISAPALAAHQIALTCAATVFMIPLGISAAASLRVGHAFGGNDRNRIGAIGIASFVVSGLVMGVTALVLILARHHIPYWFVSQGEGVAEVVSISSTLLLVAGWFQIADGIQIVGHGCLRGMGDLRIPTWITFAAYWILALPAGWILGFELGLGPVGVWIGLAIGLGAAAIVLACRFSYLIRAQNTNKARLETVSSSEKIELSR